MKGNLCMQQSPEVLSRGDVLGYASQCIQCGQCVERCPQHLNIPDLLKTIAEKFEGPDLEVWKDAARKTFGRIKS